MHLHYPRQPFDYSAYKSADAPDVLCLRFWRVEELRGAAARAHLSSFAEM